MRQYSYMLATELNFRTIPLLVTLLALLHFPAWGQEEGMRGVGKVNAPEAVETGRNLLFVIGINHYDNWLVLDNAVNDASSIEEVLSEQYGFKPALPALLDKDATRNNILEHLDLLRREVKHDDNLVFFFAGHGCTRTDSVGTHVLERGYIVPADGASLVEGKWSSYISVEEMISEIALLPARHITLLLDACHSGIALGNSTSSFRGSEEGPPLSLMSKTSRRVITSAQADQLANDSWEHGDNSVFTGILTDGLRNGLVDLDSDGMLTTSEIGLFMQREVRKYSDDLQTPDFGAFALDERGEMVLMLESNSPSILRNNARAQLNNGKVGAFLGTFQKLRELDSTSMEFLYLQSMYHLFTGNVAGSIASLEEHVERERIELPEKYHNLYSLTRQQMIAGLKRWGPYLQVVNSDGREAIDIKVLAEGEEVRPDSVDMLGMSFFLPVGSQFRFELTNRTQKPLFVYAILLDQVGRIRPFTLWRNLDLSWNEGLLPGKTAKSSIFKPVELEGFQGVRFVISEERIRDFSLQADISASDETASIPDQVKIEDLWLVFK